jgi:hypothetical protein
MDASSLRSRLSATSCSTSTYLVSTVDIPTPWPISVPLPMVADHGRMAAERSFHRGRYRTYKKRLTPRATDGNIQRRKGTERLGARTPRASCGYFLLFAFFSRAAELPALRRLRADIGGGLGHLTRQCGLTIDNLLSVALRPEQSVPGESEHQAGRCLAGRDLAFAEPNRDPACSQKSGAIPPWAKSIAERAELPADDAPVVGCRLPRQ